MVLLLMNNKATIMQRKEQVLFGYNVPILVVNILNIYFSCGDVFISILWIWKKGEYKEV